MLKEIICYKESVLPSFHLNLFDLKDVSAMLALVFAVREVNIERHVPIEFRMFKKFFALDHSNCARYGTYLQTLQRYLCHTLHPA